MDNYKELFESCTSCLARELPHLRKISGLTQSDMGGLIGVSRQTISNIESGASKMKWSQFLSFMFIFSLNHNTVEYLKSVDIPYLQLKEWLNEKIREER